MRAFAFGWRRLGPRFAALGLAATALAVLAARASAADGADAATRAEGDALWLHLPCLLLAGALPIWLGTLWPPIGRDRPAAQAVRRLARGPLEGCGAALFGAGLAMATALVGTGALFATALHGTGRALPPAAATWAIAFPARAAYPDHPLSGRLRAPRVVASVALRVTYLSGTGDALRSRLLVRADGEALGGPLEVDVVRDLVRLEFAPRTIRTIDIEVLEGQPIVVRSGHGEARGPARGRAWVSAALAALTYAPLGLVAAAVIVLLRRRIALPLSRPLGLAIVAVGALLDVGGATSAVADLGAGVLVDATATWNRAWPPMAAAAGMLALATVASASIPAAARARRR